MSNKKKTYKLDEPLRHTHHARPMSRRDFLAQGLLGGTGLLMGSSLFSMFANPRMAQAALNSCGFDIAGAGKIPFICFDLAGGAAIAGSNVLVGNRGGQQDFLSTAGYSKMGLPGDMIPSATNPDTQQSYTDTSLGLAFHSDSGFLRGIHERTSNATRDHVNGAVIPARSENDTANNPHNPMYGIAEIGARGGLLNLIGSRSSVSGGNSVAPPSLINLNHLPTKIDRPSDATGLVDTGKLVGLFDHADVVSILKTMQSISAKKIECVTSDTTIINLVNDGYLKTTDLVNSYGDPSVLNPEIDPDIVGASGIFTADEFNSDAEFRKTASIMKLVINGYAAAGTIMMGGYDYHTGERGTGELRDLRAGRCMGACLEYAARKCIPLMMYVFSDGSLTSNGSIDNSVNGRGKGVWTGDNSSTAASFFLVYNPGHRPILMGADAVAQARQQQIGYFRSDASVETASSPAANNVNLLVETVLLNYMALHGEQNNFATTFTGHGLGNSTMLDSLTAFTPIVNGTIHNPV